jgi:pyruvate/2-oxoacid:ferredoxin oxidoreductase beta subunit
MKKKPVSANTNPLLPTLLALLTQVAEETPVVLAHSLADFIPPLLQQFGQRRWVSLPAVDLPSLAAGLSLSLELKEKERRDLNVGQQNDKDVLVLAEAGETEMVASLALFPRQYPRANLLYVCLDSQLWSLGSGESYESTPWGAKTLNTPVGLSSKGNDREPTLWWQRLPWRCFAYAAQGCVVAREDFQRKIHRAVNLKGLRYLHLLVSSPLYWGFRYEEMEELLKEGVATGFWPLFEVEEGRGKINLEVKPKGGLTDFYRKQKRFAHLFSPEGEAIAERLEEERRRVWKDLRNKLKTPSP